MHEPNPDFRWGRSWWTMHTKIIYNIYNEEHSPPLLYTTHNVEIQKESSFLELVTDSQVATNHARIGPLVSTPTFQSILYDSKTWETVSSTIQGKKDSRKMSQKHEQTNILYQTGSDSRRLCRVVKNHLKFFQNLHHYSSFKKLI